ncbi:hypothetical protein [Aquipseudomonas guryensis]|uniref:Uncharacterized protein n=1 Tax=Aquipseudomonas guryensis TaxID=2759165 RepID=A0A7W4DBE4_9GAMM|nr:hypothetical protein [Pseudomonas guryensis]MBB1519468.1 hypothetical protein [Pseudomonas guryensis]
MKIERKCKACRKPIRTSNSKKITCNTSCRKALQRRKLSKIQKENFSATSFGKWLINQCRRSRTVQIIQGVDIQSLYNLWSRCSKYNGFNSGLSDRYCLSHIAPVTNRQGILALLHPQNLIVAPTSYNSARGNSWDGVSGKYLTADQIDDSFTIYGNETTSRIEQLIAKVLGRGFDDFLESTKLAASANKKLADKLKNLECPVPVNHHTDYETLSNLVERYVSHDCDARSFCTPSTPVHLVYWEEAVRLGAYVDESNVFCAEPNWDYLHNSYVSGCFAYKLESKEDIDHKTLLIWQEGELHCISLETHHGTESLIERIAYVPILDIDQAEGVNSKGYRWPKNDPWDEITLDF